GRAHDTGQHRVAAIAAAVDGDAVAPGDALVDEPLNAIGDVVLHGQPPLPESGFPECTATARGAAEVHLQHAIATIGEELRFGVEAPAVARPRPAVRIDDAGQVAGLAPARQSQIAVDGEAVPRNVLNGPHL